MCTCFHTSSNFFMYYNLGISEVVNWYPVIPCKLYPSFLFCFLFHNRLTASELDIFWLFLLALMFTHSSSILLFRISYLEVFRHNFQFLRVLWLGSLLSQNVISISLLNWMDLLSLWTYFSPCINLILYLAPWPYFLCGIAKAIFSRGWFLFAIANSWVMLLLYVLWDAAVYTRLTLGLCLAYSRLMETRGVWCAALCDAGLAFLTFQTVQCRYRQRQSDAGQNASPILWMLSVWSNVNKSSWLGRYFHLCYKCISV